jgi:putative transposase
MRVEQSEASCRIGQLCSLFGYSRQAYYKMINRQEQDNFEACIVLNEVEIIRRDQPRLGVKKLYKKLKDLLPAYGIKMGRDALYDILRENGLLVRKRRRKKPQTTFSFHHFRKYPNRAAELLPTGPNELWVSDITYIRLKRKFAYLSLITDAYSRKIVGYDLCKRLSAKGCISALEMALKGNPERSQDMLHHSDRGVQYCCHAYVDLLEEHHVSISMTQSGDPLENAKAERVNGILKDELLAERYDKYDQAKAAVERAVHLYNNERPHLSIDMLTPEQAHGKTGELKKLWKNTYATKKAKEAVMDG